MAIVALAVIIERWRSLKMLDTDNEALRQAVLEDLTNDRIEQALERCDRERGPVAAILANGLRKYLVLNRLNYDPARLEEQVVKSMESYGAHRRGTGTAFASIGHCLGRGADAGFSRDRAGNDCGLP